MLLKVMGELCIAEVKENLSKLRPQSVKHLVKAVTSCYQWDVSTVATNRASKLQPWQRCVKACMEVTHKAFPFTGDELHKWLKGQNFCEAEM